MNDIHFDLNYMNIIRRDCGGAEKEVSDSIAGFAKIAQKMGGEISSFSAEGVKAIRNIQAQIHQVRDLMREIDGKASCAESKRQNEIKYPQRPTIPSNATPEQRNAIVSSYNSKVSQIDAKNAEIRKQNERIDQYKKKCDEAKKQLEEIISQLHQVEEALKSAVEHAVSRANEFVGQANSIMNQNARVNTAMKEFTYAFHQAYEDAERLYMLEPSTVRSYSFVDKQFVIKNTHTHILGSSSGVSFNFSSDDSVPRNQEKKEKPRDTELLIKDRDEATFFAKAEETDKIKMPSANLHKLGGKKFIAKMNDMGYTLVTGEDGSTIDSSGMLHWER